MGNALRGLILEIAADTALARAMRQYNRFNRMGGGLTVRDDEKGYSVLNKKGEVLASGPDQGEVIVQLAIVADKERKAKEAQKKSAAEAEEQEQSQRREKRKGTWLGRLFDESVEDADWEADDKALQNEKEICHIIDRVERDPNSGSTILTLCGKSTRDDNFSREESVYYDRGNCKKCLKILAQRKAKLGESKKSMNESTTLKFPPGAVDGYVQLAAEMAGVDPFKGYRFDREGSTITFTARQYAEFMSFLADALENEEIVEEEDKEQIRKVLDFINSQVAQA